MYLLCAKCHRILRAKSVEKHVKKCQNATFHCCDCNDEFDAETLATHTTCANAIKTLSPPVFNPKAKVTSSALDSLRIIDRMAFEHRESADKEMYERLCEMESIPRKEKGFIENVGSFCHVSPEEAKKLWEEYSVWEKEVLKERRAYRHDRKGVNKKLKSEAKRVESKERREKQYKKESVNPVSAAPNRYEKQVMKLMRLNLDNYKQKDALKQAVIDMIKEKDEKADVSAISAVFEEKYPTMRR